MDNRQLSVIIIIMEVCMKHIYWVGIKESEIRTCKHLFDGSVTFIGTGKDGNISFSANEDYIINYNEESSELDHFMKETLHSVIDEIPDVCFFCYTTSYVYSLEDPEINAHIVCGNNRDTLQLLRNKMNSRLWLNRYVPVLPTVILSGGECQYKELCELFSKESTFTIQGCTGAGGVDTYIMSSKNHETVKSNLYRNHLYVVSPYIENSYSVNLHILFTDEGYFVTPGSIQIVEHQEERMIYRGADFIEYKKIPSQILRKIRENTDIIAEKMQLLSYEGILGIDYLVTETMVYFLEINPRFQSSTPLLNLALKDMNLPSIQELVLNNYYKDKKSAPKVLDDLEVNYSNYIIDYEDESYDYAGYISDACNCSEIVEVVLDGYNQTIKCQHGASIFSVTSRKNIISLNANGNYYIYDNIKPHPINIINLHDKSDCEWLKFSIMNQGIQFLENAINKNTLFQKGVYNSVDIYITNQFIVNAPISIPFHSISPFKIGSSQTGLALYYGKEFISNIQIDEQKEYCSHYTQKGVNFQHISFIATDRLRIHHSPSCLFQTHKRGCRFCDVPGTGVYFDIDDIKEVIDWHLENANFRHILIGGASGNYPEEYTKILEIVKYIRNKSNKSIYIMTLPPTDKTVLEQYHTYGVDEIAFNIEIYNRKLAKKIMPGKGAISLLTYQEALLHGVELWGKTGKVRSILVYGLENDASFFEGIEWLASNGIQPIISPFRALNGTVYENTVPPNTQKIIDIYHKSSDICQKYNLNLGPDCIYCQNNTLSFNPCIVVPFDN